MQDTYGSVVYCMTWSRPFDIWRYLMRYLLCNISGDRINSVPGLSYMPPG